MTVQHAGTAQSTAQETVRHIELLRAGLPEELVTPLWTPRGKRSYYVTSPGAAAALALQGDAYVSVAFLREDIAQDLRKRHKRGGEDDVAGLAGWALDFDVVNTPNGKGSVKRAGAPSVEAAITAAHLLAEPTLIILSGGGVQPWWFFAEPWIFKSLQEREQAKLGYKRWLEAHRRAAGFPIDSTFDLARLFRLAGTRNHKGGDEGAPVSILEGGW